MGSDVLMVAILAGSFAFLFIGYGIKRLSQKYPRTSLAGFRAPESIRAYYRFAFDALREHRWLRSIPIWLVLSFHLIRMPALWYLWHSVLVPMAGREGGFMSRGYTIPVTVTRVLHTLVVTSLSLSDGYSGWLMASPLVWIAGVVIVFSPGILIRRLQGYAGDDGSEGLAFVQKGLSFLRFLLPLAGIPWIAALILGHAHFAAPLGMAVMGVIWVLMTLLASVAEGFILFYVRDLAARKAVDGRQALRSSLAIIRNLFYLNIFLAVLLAIHALLPLPFSLSSLTASLMGRWSSPPPPLKLMLVSHLWQYGSAVLAAALVCAPFVLVHKKAGIREVIRSNFGFVGEYFARYLAFTAVGLLLLFLPSFFLLLTDAVLNRYTLPGLVVGTITACVGIYLAVVFFLALFKFYHDHAIKVP
jgi:hypothetical protein